MGDNKTGYPSINLNAETGGENGLNIQPKISKPFKSENNLKKENIFFETDQFWLINSRV